MNLKEGMSYIAFERQVLVAHLNGADVLVFMNTTLLGAPDQHGAV